ncbi:Pr6Pr family membrane protein [Rhodococcus gannanensis]|uniref:Pr6Pr family membrane protein n=1 Tax=Rhodococcus gannanensis TaxID=1960308 RepID=A0ABW4P6D9_9NOCA
MTDVARAPVHTHPVYRLLRLVFGALGLLALVWIPLHTENLDWFNYFGYFTVLSNVLAVIVLLAGAAADPLDRGWQMFRGAVTVYMVITGIVYAILLASIDVGMQGQWTNNLVHRVLPLVLILDWVVNPPRMRISDTQAVTWVWFPVVYGVYTLVRGPVVDWYPYPFIDPRTQGYLNMAIGLVVLVIAFVLICVAVNAAGRLGRRWRYGEDTHETPGDGVERKVEE